MTIYNLLRSNLGLITLAIILSLFSTAITLIQPALVGSLLSGVRVVEFSKPLGLLLLTILGTSAFTSATMYVASIAADRTVRNMRKKITEHLIYLRMSEFEKGGAGSFTTRVTSDTSIVSTAFSASLVDFIAGFTVIIGALIYMAVVDWRLLLVVIMVLAVALTIIVAISSSLQKLSSKVQDHLAALGEILQTALSAFRTIKAFRSESKIVDSLSAEIDQAYKNRRKMSFVEAILDPLSTVASYVALLAVVVFGSIRLNNGDLSTEKLAIFVTALFLMLAPIAQVTQSFGAFFEANGALVRINQLLKLEVEELSKQHGTPVSGSATYGAIEFENVSYRRDVRVIVNNLSVFIPAGAKVALTGPSGSGKTTLFSLLLSFYDVSTGCIRVNGLPLEDWDKRKLRTLVAYVEQEPDLLPGTLRENLTLGVKKSPADDLLISMLKRFGLEKFASPGNLERLVGSGNSGFSGGERQRIAIIRAVLQKSPIILVDEPTSALDSPSAKLVMRNLLATEATVVFTSHDADIVKLAERVLIISDGDLVKDVSISKENSDE